MGSSISPTVVSLFMEEFEIKAFNTTANPLQKWYMYLDTFVIQKAKHSHQFPQHTTSTDPHIQFTAEEPNTDGSIPFLDNLAPPGPDNRLLTTGYRKPTHTNQYLHWESHHSLSARTTCVNSPLLHKEGEHIKGALQRCKFPNWGLTRLKIKSNHAIMNFLNNRTIVWI